MSAAVVMSSYAGEWADGLREHGWRQLEYNSSVGSGRFMGARRRREIVLLSPEATARRATRREGRA